MSLKKIRRFLRMHQRPLQGRLRRHLFGEHIRAALMRTASGVYAIDIEDDIVRSSARHYDHQVEEEIRRVAQYIDGGSDVLVVGAHIGTVAIPVARLCRQLWAIEANPRTFELLTLNLKLNDVKNVQALNIVAADREEEIEFVLNRTNSGGSKRMPNVRSHLYFHDRPEVIRPKTHALDEVLTGQAFALVFMDIEGSEYLALKGMQRILDTASTLIVEYLPHHLRDVGGISPEQFLDPIAPHFDRLLIPSKNKSVARADFAQALRALYDRNEGEAGLVFTRGPEAIRVIP
jgi:FkbM family methyltransferase